MPHLDMFLGPAIVLAFPFLLWLWFKYPEVVHRFILKPLVILVCIVSGAIFLYAIATASWSELFAGLCSFLSAW